MSEHRFAFLGEILSRRPLVVAAVSALAAMLFAGSYLRQREAEIMRVAEPVGVVTAIRDMQAGETIDDASISIRKIPLRFAEPGSIGTVTDASGRIAVVSIRKDAQITAMNTRPVSETKTIAPLIPAGKRAVAMALDEAGAVANLLRPNDMVDVVATFDLGNESFVKRTTLTVVENALILAVGRDVADALPRDKNNSAKAGLFGGAETAPGAARSQTVVSVAVTPSEAQEISFAQQSGAVALLLRPFGDDGTVENTLPTTIATVTGGHDELIPMKKGFREYKGR